MNKDLAKLAIFNYVKYILQFEKILMKRYLLVSHPYINQQLIPKQGTIEFDGFFFNYKFHGAGCSVTYNKIEIDYNIYIDRKNYIVTSPWKLKQFLDSWNAMDIEEEDVKKMLDELEIEEIVMKVYNEYSVYAISFDWYNKYCSLTTKL